MQMLSLGFIAPTTWVCPAGSKEVGRAADSPLLLPLFESRVATAVTNSRCPRCKVPLVAKEYEGASILHCSFCQGNLLKLGALERIIARREETFSAEKVQEAKAWVESQKGRIKDLCHFPQIECPFCARKMVKCFHSALTMVAIDRCPDQRCQAVWCDRGELERIQMLVEEASPRILI